MSKIIRIFTSLKGKITLVFAGIFILCVILITAATYANVNTLLIGQMENHSLESLRQAASGINLSLTSVTNEYLNGFAQQLKSTAVYFYKKDPSTKKGMQAFYEFAQSPLQKPSENGFIMITDSLGRILSEPLNASTSFTATEFIKDFLKTKPLNYSFYAKNPMDDKAEFFSSAVLSMKEWNIYLWVCIPQRDSSKLSMTNGITDYLAGLNLGANRNFFLLDLSGNVIDPVGQTKNLLGNKQNNRYYMKTFYDTLNQKINKMKSMLEVKFSGDLAEWKKDLFEEFPVTLWKNFPGEEIDANKRVDKIAVWIYLPEIDAVLFETTPSSSTGQSLSMVVMKIIPVILACILAVLIVSFFFIRRLLLPIDQVHDLTQSVVQGNLDKKIMLEGHDELALLAEQVNKIIDIFRLNAQKFKTTAIKMDQAVQDLSSSSQQLSATSQQQAATIREILSSMEDAESLTNLISKKIAAVGSSAHQNKTAVEEGFDFLKNHLTAFAQIKTTETANMEDLKNLVEKINVIWEIIDMINNIADQSKIIAFNSELEALAAGDAGRNFLIVAAEIRRLADNTMGSITEIKTKITEIQHSADRVMATSKSNIADIAAASIVASKLEGVFSGIRESSAKTLESSEQITTSARQQAEGFSQILLTIKQISLGIENIASTAKLGTKTASFVKELSDDLIGTTKMYTLQQDANDEK